MKVKDQPATIKRVVVSGSEHTEDHGYVGRVRVSLDVALGSRGDLMDSDLSEALEALHSLSRERKGRGEEGANTYRLDERRSFGVIEHRFSAPDGRSEVVAVGEPKTVQYRVVEGELMMRYYFDTDLPLSLLAQLVSYMDAECSLSTSSIQYNLFKDDELAA